MGGGGEGRKDYYNVGGEVAEVLLASGWVSLGRGLGDGNGGDNYH